MQLSRSKDQIKILLLEGISETAVGVLKAAGYTNVERLTKALDGASLRQALDGVRILGIRSRTQITPEALEGNRSLIAIGCFSVGTNQVDLKVTRDMGIPVFNAPFSNTRSVAGTSRPPTATRCAARRSASSATATSATSSPCSPRRWACA